MLEEEEEEEEAVLEEEVKRTMMMRKKPQCLRKQTREVRLTQILGVTTKDEEEEWSESHHLLR